MPNKLAIFVEGFTEQAFVIRLLIELAGSRGITFEIHRQENGYLSLVEIRQHPLPSVYVLVANCCNDAQVKSQIVDKYNALKLAGYSLVIGLRDVFPLGHADINRLESELKTGLPTGATDIRLHLAILEIEAWFLEELTHFERIDPNISLQAVRDNGFDYTSIRASDLPAPAKALDNIYKCVGKRYDKKTSQIQRTVNALSYENMYETVSAKAPSFRSFLLTLEEGLFA